MFLPKARVAFFRKGNVAIASQVFLLLTRALSVGITLIAIARLLEAVIITGQQLPYVWLIVGLVGLVVAALADFGNGISQSSGAVSEEKRIRSKLLQHAFALGPARFTGRETGSLVSMLTDSVERVTRYRQGYIGQLIGSVLTPLITLTLIASTIDWVTAVVLLLCLPAVPLVIGGFQKLFSKDSGASRKLRAKLASQFLEAIQGLPTLVGLRAADHIGETLAAAGEDNRQGLMRILARNQLLLFVIEAVFSLFLVTVGLTMAWSRLESGVLDIADALAIVLLTTQLTTPITQVGGFFYIGLAGRAGQVAMRDFMKRTNAPQTSEQGYLYESQAMVSATDLTFGYDLETPVIKAVDLKIERGRRAVFLGPSGSGKSTLLNIVAGDLVPISGIVTVGGVELCTATQDAVRECSARVQQQTWLFHGTLAANLRVARMDATETDLWEALEQVALRSWVESLPDKLDTQVGERGLAVSGGQAQRISIARAIIANRDLIILDEPTSQVDLESEQVIEDIIDQLAQSSTVLLATHRPSLAKGDIYRISDQGLVTESGF